MTISNARRLACVLFLALTAAACQTASVSTTTVDPKILEGGDRAAKYHSIISAEARKHGIPVKLAHAVVRVESNYNPRARGSAGEIGLMQIRLGTARMLGYTGSAKGLYDPETNIRYGMKYLGGAHDLAGGSTCGTILRYNAGHAARRMNPVSQRYCNKVARLLDN